MAMTQSCLDNHDCFRVLLQAMSRPGTIFPLPETADRGLLPDALRVLDTVVDQQSSCCLLDADPGFAAQLQDLTHTMFKPADEADFLLAFSGHSRGRLLKAKRGRLAFPDQGATILFGVDSLSDGDRDSGVPLSGPGIKAVNYPRIAGLGPEELKHLHLVNAEFPLGVDAIFLDRKSNLMCIPRSTRIGVH